MTTQTTGSDTPARRSPGGAAAAAIGLMLSASACFALSDLLAKRAMDRYSGLEVVWFRYLGMAGVLAVMLFWRGAPARSGTPRLQIARGVGLVASALFYNLALSAMPLAETTAIAFASPLFVTLASALVLRERVDATAWAIVATGFAGVLLVMQPGSAAFRPAALLALASAASWAAAVAATRQSIEHDSVATATAYSSAIGLAVLSPLALPGMPLPDAREGATLAAAAIVWGSAQWLALEAFHRAQASRLAPFAYTQLLWATLYSFLVFAHVPDGWAAIGIAVIIGSGVFAGWRSWRRGAAADATGAHPVAGG
jgi:drug/metabolite transporter (DMT)-like permease